MQKTVRTTDFEMEKKVETEYLSEYYFLWFITSARIVLSFNIKMKQSERERKNNEKLLYSRHCGMHSILILVRRQMHTKLVPNKNTYAEIKKKIELYL